MPASDLLLNLAAAEPDEAARARLVLSARGALLRERILDYHGCGLRALARTPVPWSGSPAPLAVVGEAPGADEERDGVPFVGRSGHLLDLILREVGLERAGVVAMNAVSCRPPDNDFKVAERMGAPFACRGWLPTST
jgi:DNA polymerase